MAQQVNSVPNPNYAVTPLTTVAGSIVSRRRLKVPANLNGTYTHAKGNFPSTITFDIADNECFVDLSKLVFVADLKPSFPPNLPFPQFDGSVQSLIAKITIGSSQGLKIEEISNYNLLSNMVQSITETNIHKESTFSEYSSYTHFTSQQFTDANSFLDGQAYRAPIEITVDKTYRLHVRFHQSSFLNRVKMLPLFLFRNGLRIEIELDDFHKSFNYSNCPNVSEMLCLPYQITGLQELESCGLPSFFFAESFKDAENNVIPLPDLGNIVQWGTYFEGDKTIYNRKFLLNHYTYLKIYEQLYSSADNIGSTTPKPVNRGHSEDYFFLVPFSIVGNLDTNQNEIVLFSGILQVLSACAPFVLTTNDNGDEIILGGQPSNNTKGSQLYYLHLVSSFISDDNLSVGIPDKEYPASLANLLNEFYHQTNSMRLYVDIKNAVSVQKYQTHTNLTHIKCLGNFYRYLMKEQDISDLMGSYKTYLGYTLHNPELLLDVIKPSADEFLKYTQAFQSPSGIPYNYKRIIYKHKTIDNPGSSSFVQLPIDLAVRSLTGILFTFQDPITSIPTQDSKTFLSYPTLSSFLRRGLVRYEVIVGGQQYPLYPLYIRRLQDGVLNNEVNESFIFELENFFAVNGTSGVIPSISRSKILLDRNYASVQSFASLNTSAASEISKQYSSGNSKHKIILDSSNAIFGLSLSKDDINNFASGIDSSQSGSVILNLYFDDPSSSNYGYGQFNRAIKVNIFCFCDAVFTLQSDANLVRY